MRSALLLCLFIAVAGLAGSRWRSSLPTDLTGAPHETVLPATIAPAKQFQLMAEYAGRIQQTPLPAGSLVEEGQVIVVLENREISGQLEMARKRVEIAELRLRAVRAKSSSKHDPVEQERTEAALRDRSAAEERLKAFSLEEDAQSLKDARLRVREIRGLVGQGFATATELENAEARERSASRNLQAAGERQSRFRQEFEQANSQLRLLQIQPSDFRAGLAAAESDFADAETALRVAADRVQRLTLAAPGPGTITDLPVSPGESIVAGATLARIADLSSLVISAAVNAAVARRVTPGYPVHVRLPSDPPARLAATVYGVSLAADPAQRAYMIRIVVPNPDPKTVLAGLEAAIEFDHIEHR